MPFMLAPAAAAAGYRLEAHDTVASTNMLALEAAGAGTPGGMWFAALRQTQGRGRRARAWESPHGNLAATLLHIEPGPREHAAILGFVAGLALHAALEAVGAGRANFKLKWPNDVLAETGAGRAKLAGILLESVMTADGGIAIAIGMGVNIIAHPEGTPFPSTSLSALGVSTDARRLFLALSDAWVGLADLWDGGRGRAAIRDLWLDKAAGRGGPVAVSHAGSIINGTFQTIDDDCRLVIRDAEGHLHHITVGDVHFGQTASVHATSAHH
jgi:BirA family transcriptional regulator, biotin operon repressor / biotin---[acetyl-CoA-carboxylase] ligase